MKKLLILPVFALFAVLLISCGLDSKTIYRIQALEEGVDRPTTVEELTVAIKKYQNRIQDILTAEERIGSWYKILGSKYLDSKMYGKALENYRAAVDYYPTNQNLFFYIGVCAGFMSKSALDYEATGSRAERDRYLALAESAYLRAIELHPKYARALYALSVLYVFELNTPEKARIPLETVLEIEKNNSDAMFVLGRVYYTLGRYDESVAMYDRIIGLTQDPVKKTEAENNKKQVLQQSYGQE